MQLGAAGHWRQAHETLMAELAPAWLLGGRTAALRPHLETMQLHADNIEPAFAAGGGLYLDFLCLRQLYSDPSAAMPAEELQRFAATLALASTAAARPAQQVPLQPRPQDNA